MASFDPPTPPRPAGPPSQPSTQPPPPAHPVTGPSASGPRRGVSWVTLVAVGVAVASQAALVTVLVIRSGDDESASTTAPAATSPATTDTSAAPTTTAFDGLDPSALAAGEVLLEAVGVPVAHAFTESVAVEPESPPTVVLPDLALPTTTAPLPAGQVALAEVAGREPGLYGGTRDVAACDPEQMIEFLEADPVKAAAWAGVHGIDPTDIREFIEGLTPVVLTRDTRVTNHGFADGRARPHPSVLQAGHAVLVDEFGVPRAKCSCGNPLAPPRPLATAPVFVGDPWPTFDPRVIIVVIATDPVDGGFVIVDVVNGELIVRPGGFRPGDSDEVYAPEVTLVDIGNIGGVTPGTDLAARFTVDAPTLITYIQHYHYGPESPPGQLGLTAADGTFYGPWQAVGSEGQGGVRDAYWTAEPMVVIPPGTYTVWDSEPSTWSTNAEAGGVGFSVVRGRVGVNLPVDPGAPGTAPPTGPPPTTADELLQEASLQILDLLLLDCGYDVREWTNEGPVADGWAWTAQLADGAAVFIVRDPAGDWWVEPATERAGMIAIECGFYQP